jgi:hypothetical protein
MQEEKPIEQESPQNDMPETHPLVLSVKKDIQGWGKALIFIGILSFIFSGFLDFLWGVILVILGIISFFILEPAMYIIFGCVIIMLGIINSLTTSTGWSVYSLFQFIIGFFILRSYFNYREYYKIVHQKSSKFFIMSIVLFFMSLATLIGSLTMASMGYQEAKSIEIIFQLSSYLAIIGTATGLASILTEKIFKLFPIVMTILNFIVFLAFVAIMMMSI